MGDETKMVGANSKLYLRGKIGDCKRRRPNSALLESSDMLDESVDISTSFRQIIRQSAQRQLTAVTNGSEKLNRPEQTSRLITYGSKKHFRCSKLDAERFYNCDELTSPCFLTHYNKSDVEELILNKTDSTVCIGNSNNPKNSVNKLKTGGSFDNMNFKKQDFPEGKINVDNHDSEQDRSEEDETVEIKKQKEKKDNENCRSSIYSSSNKTITEKLGRTLYQTKIANSTKYASLVYENRKSRDVFKARSTNIISESVDVTPNRKRKLEDKIALGDSENFNDITKNEINNGNEINYFKYAPLTENVSFLLLQPSPDILNDNNQIQEHYENQLSRSNNSLCSEISSLSSSCYKISVEDDKDFCNNESKASLEEVNQKNALNLTINPSLINFISREQEGDIANSQSDKQYQLFSDVNSNGCGIKCSPRLSPYNITTVCTELNNATSTYAKSSFNLKLEDISFEYDTTENVLITENIEFKKKSDNKQEQENICFVSKPNALQNINSKQTHLNSDPCLENNLKEAASVMNDQVSQRNCTLKKEEQHLNSKKNEPETKEQHFIKYVGGSSSQKQEDGFDEAQPSDRTASHQQLEKDIINAAKNVYTQIEEQYYQHQHVLPLSSGYERVTNSKQHPHHPGQQDHDEHHQRHDINLSLQQNHPPQHHSILQQQPYSDIQLYQVQQQDQHQDDQIQKQIELQQHHHSTSRRYQRESGQHHHSHLMDFLHSQHHHHSTTDMQSALHQQQHQIHEVYNDLMMDEFHDEHHTPYKLGLSPSTVKHENQDDGYETSAGDVLTPNSHISSTHSVTPQHHIQHGASDGGYTTNITKCNEKQHQSQQYNIHLQQHSRQLLKDQNMQQELTLNEPVRNPTPRDIYFIDDDLNSRSNNNSFRNILTPRLGTQEAGTINNFLLVQSDATSNVLSTASDMHGSTNSTLNHLFQKKVDIGLMSTTVINMDYEQYHVKVTGADIIVHDQDSVLNLRTKPIQKRRGRKKKIAEAVVLPTLERTNLNNVNSTAGYIKTKERKKHDRFNGMSQEEIVKRILPDHLCDNLDIVIIGINPGLFAAYKGHHYAGPGNHFWKCLYLSGLIQEQMNADEDFKLIKYGIGFTNMVQRVTKGSADLTRKEIKEGSRILLEKLQRFRPKIAVFNGKLIFEVFSGKKDFNFGRQPECVEGTDTFIWVMPSSSARCAQLPRAADKVPFYAALKKFRDYLNGIIPHIDQSECVFTEERIKQMCEQQNYKNQQNNVSGSTVDTFSDAIGIRNSYISLHSNTFDSKPNPHGAGGGTGPPSTSAEDNNVSTSFMMSSLIGPQCEKKKRGRPKKMKYQEIIDPVTGNKREYSNILNLSVTQASNNIMPKKSRGRPKKVKLPTNTLQLDVAQSSPMLSQKSSILSIYAMTSDIIQDHMQRIQPSHQHASLYSTPPPTTMVSPMASPSLNCSYTTNTPSQPNHDKSILTSNERESSKTTIEVLSSHHSINDQNFCESLSPNSPNICAVDFDPPTAFAATSSFLVSDNVNSDVNIVRQQRLRNSQKSPYSSPNNDEATHHNTNTEHFHQWLSPHRNYNVHSPAAATIASHSLQQASLNYQDQQQDTHARWPLRHQSRCNDNPYLLYSLHQTHSHQNESHNHQAQQLSGNDVARKSLCGLESLVDQIPTISESESIVLLSAAVENRLVTTLAPTIESRLQKMQNSFHNDTQNADCSHFSTITRPSNLLTADNSPASSASTNQMQRSNTATSLLNNNFSVSNLAASSLSSNNNNNNQPNYCLPSDPTTLTNTNPHRHSNLMAAAVLAAAVNSPSNLSAPAASSPVAHHAQIYMDPHTHLTSHVPINPIYSTAAQSHHHHTAVAAHHHHRAAAGAAVHYNSAQHSATDYATVNNPCVSSQSNVTGNTLHMPSPNYPYGYSTTSTQSNYSAYPHTYADHHHGHPHAHHTTHHLDLFDRSKPSNITGYSGGF